jgi:hypothetical protein
VEKSRTVWVRRQWSHHDRKALYSIDALSKIHWSALEGGSPRSLPIRSCALWWTVMEL